MFRRSDAIWSEEERRVAVSRVKVSVLTRVATVIAERPEKHFVGTDGKAMPSL
jgi:hypothetical protein